LVAIQALRSVAESTGLGNPTWEPTLVAMQALRSVAESTGLGNPT
jgi:hypothetical protein